MTAGHDDKETMDDVARQLGTELPGGTCEEVRSHLFEMLDREMTDEQLERLAAHARTCPTCTEAAEAEQHLRSIIKRSCCEEAPASLRARVVTQITKTTG